MLKDINSGAADSMIFCSRQCQYASFTVLNGQLLFSAIDAEHGFELWQSDGTPTGTAWLKDIQPGPTGSFPISLLNIGDTLFFVADDGTNGSELWKSDGTADGTVMVKRLVISFSLLFRYPQIPMPTIICGSLTARAMVRNNLCNFLIPARWANMNWSMQMVASSS